MFYYRICLLIAIVTEVMGTIAMKYSAEGARWIGLGIMYVMLIISYSTFALAIKRIPLALAYGTWESLGLVLIALFSHFLFNEHMTAAKIMAIVFIIVGIILLEKGTKEANSS